jgi:hypothetical protein
VSKLGLASRFIGIGFFIGGAIVGGIFLGIWLDGFFRGGIIVGLFIGLIVAFVGTYRMLVPVLEKDKNGRGRRG